MVACSRSDGEPGFEAQPASLAWTLVAGLVRELREPSQLPERRDSNETVSLETAPSRVGGDCRHPTLALSLGVQVMCVCVHITYVHYVCVYTTISTRMYLYMCVYIYIYAHTFKYIPIHTCILMCVCVHMHACMHVMHASFLSGPGPGLLPAPPGANPQ